MATGQVRKEETNVPGMKGFATISKEAPPVVRVAAPANKQRLNSSTYQAATQDSVDTTSEPVKEVAAEKVEKAETPDRKAERQKEWSELNAAARMKAEAEELRKQSKSFEDVKNSPQKLQSIAKALGMSSDELLMQLNNERLSVPTNKVLTPEEQSKAEALEYKNKLSELENKQLNLEAYTAKVAHINKAIMPILTKSPDDFEFCYRYGVDKCAEEVYNECNRAHLAGEKFSELEVLQEFENQLYEGWKQNVEAAKDTKKASKYFGKDTKPTEAALGATPKTAAAAKTLETELKGMNDPTAKRISRKSNVGQSVDMNNLANNNKLSGQPSAKSIFDKAERKRRIIEGV